MKQHGTVVITGSLGLLGSACVRLFSPVAERVVGIDNGGRGQFFGEEGSTNTGVKSWMKSNYCGYTYDICDKKKIDDLFFTNQGSITAVIHCAAQPAHDYSAKYPLRDFYVNVLGTMHVLEACRQHCPEAPFVFASTSKVYGDSVNRLPIRIRDRRFIVDDSSEHARGITETLSIDHSLHSPYGAGKASADLYVQEYGRYFGLRVACFRPGTITGPDHAAVELHGFLAYLIKCCATGRPYTVNGYGGYQVRDVIHADDLARAFAAVIDDPPPPHEPFVTNFGGGLHSNCSMLEVIALAEEACKRKLDWTYNPTPRKGDHMWYIGSCEKFIDRYVPHKSKGFWEEMAKRGIERVPYDPNQFEYKYTLPQIVAEIEDRYVTGTKESA